MNVISGANAAWNQTGYVFRPQQDYQITGWRKSDDELAACTAPMPAPKLGTGHGEREYSHVENTEFERRQTQPDEIIRSRYDSLDNLVAMGIVAPPRPLAPVANSFPASPQQQYVPDPPPGVRGDSL